MNQWLGITKMREDAKMAGRKEHSVGCVFAKLRRDMNSVKTKSKNTTREKSNNKSELPRTEQEATRRAQHRKNLLSVRVAWKEEKAIAMSSTREKRKQSKLEHPGREKPAQHWLS